MSTINAGQINATEQLRLPSYNNAQRDALSGLPTGFTIFNSEELTVQCWSGTEWVSGGSTNEDGSSADRAAASLQSLLDAGVTTDGIYWFKDSADVTYQAYAKIQNTYDDKAWILAFTINTDSANNHLGGIPHWENTTFWQAKNDQNAANTNPWGVNVKTRAFDKYPVSEILFVAHKQGGFDNIAAQVHGYGIYNNDNYPGQTLFDMFSGGNDKTVSNGGRTAWSDYSNLLTWNPNRPQILGGDLFISGTINGYDNSQYSLMFNVTNNFNSSNYARARISTSGAAGNSNYGYTAGGVGVHHGHNNNWGGYAGYAPVSAYCSGREIYGSATNGVNYLKAQNPSGPFINCMGGGNGVVNYNLALFVR